MRVKLEGRGLLSRWLWALRLPVLIYQQIGSERSAFPQQFGFVVPGADRLALGGKGKGKGKGKGEGGGYSYGNSAWGVQAFLGGCICDAVQGNNIMQTIHKIWFS